MGLRSSIRQRLIRLSQRAVTNIHELQYIFFELTHRCNLACLHCGSDCLCDSKTPDLPSGDVLRVLDDIRSEYDPHKIMVILSGGEPLCYPGVFELGREMTGKEFPWGMVTNGYAWDEGLLERARLAGMQSITVSLDGFEEEHNWLRGNARSYERAVNLIRMLVKDPFYQKMDVVTCLNKRTLSHLDDLYAHVVDLGVKDWRLFTISPIGRAADHPDLILDALEFERLFEKILEFRSRKEIAVSYSESGYLGPVYDCAVRDAGFFCRAGINIAGIMVNGDILACPNIDRRFRQGNIATDRFTDIWERGFEVFRDRSWMRTGRCSDCKEWRSCRGNSFHLWDLDRNETRLCYVEILDKKNSRS